VADANSRKRKARIVADQEEEFVYYRSLPPGERSYEAVAKHFGNSRRTVEKHGRDGRWRQRLREIEQEAARRSQELLITGRVEELQKMQHLINASLLAYAQRLQEGRMNMGPVDLERLNRLSRALLDELDETASGEAAAAMAGPPERTVAHAEAVVAALAKAGALEELRLTYTPVEATESDGEGGP
jgi:hypothetical protein